MPQRRYSNQSMVCRCSAVNFGQIWFYTFFTLMIIYYIVFRTILHQHLFLHHITTSPILPVFPTTTVGEEKAGVLWGPFWRYWEVFLLGYWWYIGNGRGPLGPAVEISVQHQIHTINFVLFSSCSSRPLMVVHVRSGIQFLLLQHLLINVIDEKKNSVWSCFH